MSQPPHLSYCNEIIGYSSFSDPRKFGNCSANINPNIAFDSYCGANNLAATRSFTLLKNQHIVNMPLLQNGSNSLFRYGSLLLTTESNAIFGLTHQSRFIPLFLKYLFFLGSTRCSTENPLCRDSVLWDVFGRIQSAVLPTEKSFYLEWNGER